jgi:hypothetical protein
LCYLWIYSWVKIEKEISLILSICRLFTTFVETKWGSSTSFPTPEMKSRGDIKRLWVGVLIALPSGAGVALSVLGGNTGKNI